MKILLLLLALTASLMGQEMRFKSVKKSYAKALGDLNSQYVKTLERVLKDATRAGDLDLALEIKAEITKYNPEYKDSSKLDVEGTTWLWHPSGSRITFKPKGKMEFISPRGNKFEWKWEAKADGIHIKHDAGKEKLEFKGESLVRTEGNHTGFTLTKLK